MRQIKCLFGFHDWFSVYEEYRPSEDRGHVMTDLGTTHYFDGKCAVYTCAECGYERVTQFGYTEVKKPWEMSVRKMKWDKQNRKYV